MAGVPICSAAHFCLALSTQSGCYGQREAGEDGLQPLLGRDRDARGEDAAPLPTDKASHRERQVGRRCTAPRFTPMICVP